ncbi:MAG TPA: hypothetical protein VGO53_16350 [Steroidobacteraceae bacterium]|jgi:hypothetical protein|nr:hypothetical protein [Steroidobacteraceae bacterium]
MPTLEEQHVREELHALEQLREYCHRTRLGMSEQSAVKLLRAEVWAKVYAAEFVRDEATGPVNASAVADRAAADFDNYCQSQGL